MTRRVSSGNGYLPREMENNTREVDQLYVCAIVRIGSMVSTV